MESVQLAPSRRITPLPRRVTAGGTADVVIDSEGFKVPALPTNRFTPRRVATNSTVRRATVAKVLQAAINSGVLAVPIVHYVAAPFGVNPESLKPLPRNVKSGRVIGVKLLSEAVPMVESKLWFSLAVKNTKDIFKVGFVSTWPQHADEKMNEMYRTYTLEQIRAELMDRVVRVANETMIDGRSTAQIIRHADDG